MAETTRRLIGSIPYLIAGTTTLVGLGIMLLPPLPGLEARPSHALGIVIIIVGLFATQAIPAPLTALVFFLLALTTGIAEPTTAFAGFQAQGPWLIFSGIIIGAAIQQTGFGKRLAEALVSRISGSYTGIVGGTVLVAAGLSFVMPSAMGRTVILLPIVMAFAERLGFEKGSNGHAAICLGLGIGTMIPPMALLPATVPNTILLGSVESLHGIELRYAEFAILHLPVAGLASLASLMVILRFLLPDVPQGRPDPEPQGPWTAGEKRLLMVLAGTLAFWVTDSIHEVGPGWIGLAAAVVCLLPGIGMTNKDTLSRGVDYGPMFFVAGVIGLGAMVAATGLADWVGGFLLDAAEFENGSDFRNFALSTLVAGGLAPLMTYAGVPAVLTPLAPAIAEATGWPLLTVLMTQVSGFFTIFLPFQAPPLVAVLLLARVRYGTALKVCAAFTLVYIVLIMPVNFLWWRALGMFG